MSKIESGTVDLIYCDILYGTGRKFADYKDLNRNFVGCDINSRAVELSKKRCGLSF